MQFSTAITAVLSVLSVLSTLVFVAAHDGPHYGVSTSSVSGTPIVLYPTTLSVPVATDTFVASTDAIITSSLPSLSSLGTPVFTNSAVTTGVQTSPSFTLSSPVVVGSSTVVSTSTALIDTITPSTSTSTSETTVTHANSTISHTSTIPPSPISSPVTQSPVPTTSRAASLAAGGGHLILGIFTAPVLACMVIILSNLAFASASPDIWRISTVYEQALNERQSQNTFLLHEALSI